MRPTIPQIFEDVISKPRLDSYRGYFHLANPNEAIGIYMWNTDLSACFNALMAMFEIALRNSVHRAMSLSYSRQAATSIHWYDTIRGSLSADTTKKVDEVRYEWVRRRGQRVRQLRTPAPSPDEIVSSETLADSKRQAGAATPDLAALIGSRLVLSSETEDNTALAEALVKSLVSGDSIAVRHLYAAPVQFTPNFKLVMAGNHKPIVRGNDNGIWRRIRLVPFNRTFAPEERDPHLLATLQGEASHILAWMVAGCIEWQQQGLAVTPTAISAATDEYREDQDITGRWLEECTIRDPHGEATTGDLYASYSQWCLDNGLRPASTVVLGRRLSERGYIGRKSGSKRLWRGLALTDLRHATTDSYLRATKGY